MNAKVSDRAKHLNLLKHLTATKSLRLKTMEDHFDCISFEVAYVQDTVSGVNKDGQDMRDMENRLDKASLKCSEVEQIRKVYLQIKCKLQEVCSFDLLGIDR